MKPYFFNSGRIGQTRRGETREGFAMTSHTEAWIQGQLDGYAMRAFNPRDCDETEYRLGYEEGRKRICG